MTITNWISRWNSWIRPTKVPGVWQLKTGGYLVRARAIDRTTGKLREIRKALPRATEAEAYVHLNELLEHVRRGDRRAPSSKTRFAEYAASLLERKLAVGDIKSAKSEVRWRSSLEHIILGEGDVIPGFGDFYIDQIRSHHIEEWRSKLGKMVAQKTYSPHTVNGWISIFRVILKAAKRDLSLAMNPIEDIEDLSTSNWDVYTEEEPNSLAPSEAKAFLKCMRAKYPQHYAMVFLGLATGLRPSSMRPIRRKGNTPDVLWDENVLLVRRSHTVGNDIMNTTKSGKKQRIGLPQEVMDVLRWHVATQLARPEQEESELLFPSLTGGYRTHTVLRKPLDAVMIELGLGKRLSPRGLRRTFNDLARASNASQLVTKSISGHATDRMVEHYSTVRTAEQRTEIGRLISQVSPLAPTGTHSGTQSGSDGMHSASAEGQTP